MGFTTDLDGLIFSARKGARTGSFVVPLGEELVDTIAEAQRLRNGDESDRPPAAPNSQPERRRLRAESALTPREIQARIRAGHSVADVAVEAGVDLDWIERFAVPILAEQARMIEQGRSATFSKPRRGESALPLGPSVAQNLSVRGAAVPPDVFDAAWAAHHLHGGVWMIRFRYRSRGRPHAATWTLEVPSNELLAANRLGSELGYVDKLRHQAVVADDGGATQPDGADAPPPPRRRRSPSARKVSVRKAPAARKAGSRAGAAKSRPRTGGSPTARKAAASARKSASRTRPAAATRAAARTGAAAAERGTPRKGAASRSAATRKAAATRKTAPTRSGPPARKAAARKGATSRAATSPRKAAPRSGTASRTTAAAGRSGTASRTTAAAGRSGTASRTTPAAGRSGTAALPRPASRASTRARDGSTSRASAGTAPAVASSRRSQTATRPTPATDGRQAVRPAPAPSSLRREAPVPAPATTDRRAVRSSEAGSVPAGPEPARRLGGAIALGPSAREAEPARMEAVPDTAEANVSSTGFRARIAAHRASELADDGSGSGARRRETRPREKSVPSTILAPA